MLILRLTLLLQDAELVFNDEIFTPEISSHPADNDVIEDNDNIPGDNDNNNNKIGDDAQPGASTTKISPGLKRKAAAEAAKNERCVLSWYIELRN